MLTQRVWLQTRLLLTFLVAILICLYSSSPVLGAIVINEFMASNSQVITDEVGQYEDWIELYNTSTVAVDLAGWTLTDDLGEPDKWPFPSGQPDVTTIPPYGFLLVWADQDDQDGPLHADFKLSQNGEEIGLFNASGVRVDRLTYTAQQSNLSLGRYPDGSSSWQVMTQPTPRASNRIASNGIVINEIMYHPYHEEDQREPLELEFIELWNSDSQSIDLSGWSFDRGIDFTFPDGTTVAGQGYLVVAADVEAFTAAYPAVTSVVGDWNGRLSNRGETLNLVDETGQRIDRVRYSDQGAWAARILGPVDYNMRGWEWLAEHDGQGASLECRVPSYDNQYGENWAGSQTTGGTPGAVNSQLTTRLAPIIHGVEHTPLIPNSQNMITVTAEVEAQALVQQVTLYYRVDTSVYERDVYPIDDRASFTAVTMSFVSGQQYQALIPAHPHGTILEVFIEAADIWGQQRTWPAASDIDGAPSQVTNLLIQVDDTYDAAMIHTPGTPPRDYLIMTAMEKGRLIDIGDGSSGDHNSNAQMNATFISVSGQGEKVRYGVGVRNRGHGSRDEPPNNYRVNFRHDDPWNGVTEINLNARYPYMQVAGSALMQMASIPAADARLVQVRVNGEDLASTGSMQYGLYAENEVINSDFADHRFPLNNGGNLYKCMRSDSTGRQANLSYLGEDADDYRENYFKQSNESQQDFSDLMGLTAALSLDADDPNFISSVEAVADVDEWMRFLAINVLLDNSETNISNGNGDDYYLYRGLVDPHFVMVAYDLDSILSLGNSSTSPEETLLPFDNITVLSRLLSVSDYASAYYRHMQQLIEGPLSVERARLVLTPLLQGLIPDSRLEAMLSYLDTRGQYFLTQIPQEFTITTGLPEFNGFAITGEATVVPYGLAPSVDTRSVTVNGIVAHWEALGGSWVLDDSGVVDQRDTLIEEEAVWFYQDEGVDLGADWFLEDFTTWLSGPAQLGYGDGDEATAINYMDTDPCTTTVEKNITTYFMHSFEVTDPEVYDHLSLRLQRDDGAVVYLNGVELLRSNMPTGTIDANTLASGSVGSSAESTWFGELTSGEDYTRLSTAALHAGTNVLAVEIHQHSATSSSDISFALALEGVYPASGILALNSGINRLTAQAWDGPDGTGQLVDEANLDVWYESGHSSSLGGTLAADTFLDVDSGPWIIESTLVVPDGVTLTIKAGTSLFFESGVGLEVQEGGRLLAYGSLWQHIRMTTVPGENDRWQGIEFDGSHEDNQLCYVDIESGDGQGESMVIDDAQVLLDHVTFSGTNRRMIELSHPLALIRHCVFPSIGSTEPVHGSGLSGDDYLIFESCTFGSATGYNDIIDFTGGQRPGPIMQLYDNTFLGGTDDGLDLDGTDAHIEGNWFMNFHADDSSDSTSNAIATGQSSGNTADLVVARNTFVDCDHSLLLKEDCYAWTQNNTFVGNTIGVISFGEPLRNPPRTAGLGVLLENNIFWDNADPFEYVFEEPVPDYGPEILDLLANVLPEPWNQEGVDNVSADPLLMNSGQVLSDSIAATGLDGDGPMGSWISSGAKVLGEPTSVTCHTDAILTVTGPGITHYQYSVDDPNGPWSDTLDIDEPIELSDLAVGVDHRVYVLGLNSAGRWQESPSVSDVWTIDPTFRDLKISEVLVCNDTILHEGRLPSLIELSYDGPETLSLAGYHLVIEDPAQDVTLSGSMAPGDLLVLACDDLGLVLDPNGATLSLMSPGGRVVDTVTFGHQLSDLSIGRIGRQGQWTLTEPTFGQVNRRCPLGDPAEVCLNEWLAMDDQQADFVELYNRHAQPVHIGGFFLTDEPMGWPDQMALPDLSFIAGQGHATLTLGDVFGLSNRGEALALFDRRGQCLDRIIFGPQVEGVSQGRFPDGADEILWLERPTPGQSN